MKNKITVDTKERILKAALEVFVEKGKYGARMHEIADKAKINKAMLHYYFTDKDTLYEKSIEYIFRSIFTRVEKVFDEEETFEAKIRSFVYEYNDYLRKNIYISRIIQREILEGAVVLKKIIRNYSSQDSVFFGPAQVKNVMEESIKTGEIRNVDTVQTLISIIGMNVFYFIAKPVMETLWGIEPGDTDKFLEKRKKCVSDFIIHGLKK